VRLGKKKQGLVSGREKVGGDDAVLEGRTTRVLRGKSRNKAASKELRRNFGGSKGAAGQKESKSRIRNWREGKVVETYVPVGTLNEGNAGEHVVYCGVSCKRGKRRAWEEKRRGKLSLRPR